MKSVMCADDNCIQRVHLSDDAHTIYQQHGKTFFCPAGHANVYAEDPRESEIRSLKRQLEWQSDATNEAWRERDASRVAARTCPLCGERQRTRRGLVRHLTSEHGAT